MLEELDNTRNVGASLRLGLRSGLLSNTFLVHAPFFGFPPMVEFKMGVGVNAYRKE